MTGERGEEEKESRYKETYQANRQKKPSQQTKKAVHPMKQLNLQIEEQE